MSDPSTGTVGRATRFREIDGIRGWAALLVVCFHMFWETFGVIQPEFRNTFMRTLLNGSLDVAVFFVLSGDALSSGYWATGSNLSVVRLAVKRYSRLTVPIFFSCLGAFLLWKYGLVFAHPASVIVQRPTWLGVFLSEEYSWKIFFSYSFSDVYFHTGPRSLNPFLWTMPIEMLGSIVVFLYLMCDGFIAKKYHILCILALIFLVGSPYFSCFIVGMIYARLRSNGVFDVLQKNYFSKIYMLGAFFLLFSLPYQYKISTDPILYNILASWFLVFFIYANSAMRRFFCSKFSQWLGKISFPLYLVHFLVVVSFTSGMIVLADGRGLLDRLTIWLIAAASVAVSIAMAIAFQPVEVLTRNIGNALCGWIGLRDVKAVLPADRLTAPMAGGRLQPSTVPLP